MKLAQLISESLAIDLETKGDKIYRIGALCGTKSFERKGSFNVAQALDDLDLLAKDCHYLIGHNILDFDLPLLQRLFPHLKLLGKPAIDTLYLSPLAFPENPYHRLVKDYKLVKDSLNDPVADARLSLTLFQDQWHSFAELAKTDRTHLLSLYRYCLQNGNLAADLNAGGLAAVFDGLGAPVVTENQAWAIFRDISEGRACKVAAVDLGRTILTAVRNTGRLWLIVQPGCRWRALIRCFHPGCAIVSQKLSIS